MKKTKYSPAYHIANKYRELCFRFISHLYDVEALEQVGYVCKYVNTMQVYYIIL